MSALRLTLRAEPEQRLDLSILTPDRLAGLNGQEIMNLPVATTRQKLVVGDVFSLRSGDVTDIVIEGGSPRLDEVGTAMTSGQIRVEGAVGFRAGHRMRGGKLIVNGPADSEAAAGLLGGEIVIYGDAGSALAGPALGEPTGMRGGIVVVHGSAGPNAGTRLRRGTVIIEGNAGVGAGFGMIAGTLIVCGRSLGHTARLMRRGSMVLGQSTPLGPGFLPAGGVSPVFHTLLTGFVRSVSPVAAAVLAGRLQRFAGDLSADGQGEIFVAAEVG